MTTLEDKFKNNDQFVNWQKNQQRGRIAGGFFLILIAAAFFLKEMGVLFPHWLFTWPMILIIVGIVSGIKHKFKNFRWLIPILIGGVFLLDHILPGFSLYKYHVPLILLIIGLFFIFKSKNNHRHYGRWHRKHRRHWDHRGDCRNYGPYDETFQDSSDDYIIIENVFGSTKRNIISKDFKGGDITNTCGGCEINLMQAEIANEAVITINQRLSGTKLIIPANWNIRSEVVCVMGAVEDQRPLVPINDGDVIRKTIVLKGSIFMSGVEIVSF